MSSAVTTTYPAHRADRKFAGEGRSAGRRSRLGPLVGFLLVFGAQFAFGMWMNDRGFLWFDAVSRATSALMALHSTDPHLAAVGFVWMPLPTLIEIIWVIAYPFWPGIVSSGFASTLTSALAGGTTALILLGVSRALGLSGRLGWAFALLVSFNPMLFLYASNGMSEGVAAPFLTGTVAFITLFWHSGRRRYVLLAGLALALAFASLYEAVPYGAFLFVVLILGLLWPSESRYSASQGRWRSVEGLGLLFLVPSVYLGLLWIGANWMIMGDPLFFATGVYSNAMQVSTVDGGVVLALAGDLPGALLFVLLRTAPFLIPGLLLLFARAVDGRLLRMNTLALLLLLVAPSVAFNVPFIYEGSSYGWLRYFMYPLFVAAGWGLYEVYLSKKRCRVQGLVLAGWVLAAPVILWAMSNPSWGSPEAPQVRALFTGEEYFPAGFRNIIAEAPPVPVYLETEVFSKGDVVLADSFSGWPIAAQVSPKSLRNQLIMTPDRHFQDALAKPEKYGVRYFLVPDPEKVAYDAINHKYPKLWSGEDPAFEQVKSFAKSAGSVTPQNWRLYEFFPPGSDEYKRNLARIGGQAEDPEDARTDQRIGVVPEQRESNSANGSPHGGILESGAHSAKVLETSNGTGDLPKRWAESVRAPGPSVVAPSIEMRGCVRRRLVCDE